MARIDRIRRQIVSKTMSNEAWMEENPEDVTVTSGVFGQGQLGRHLLRQTERKRRVIVERLFDLSSRDVIED